MKALQTFEPILLVVIVVIGALLAVLAALMPFFVWMIHGNVERLREIAEKKQETEASDLKAVAEALRDVGDSRSELVSALAEQQRAVTALVEQQRTIKALHQRLDELQHEPPPSDLSRK